MGKASGMNHLGLDKDRSEGWSVVGRNHGAPGVIGLTTTPTISHCLPRSCPPSLRHKTEPFRNLEVSGTI